MHGIYTNRRREFLKILKKAESGDIQSQYLVGDMYANGDGVFKDEDKAKYWLTKASNSGDVDAMVKLAEILFWNYYLSDDNSKKKYGNMCLYHIEKAISLNDVKASFIKAYLYHIGEIVKVDNDKSLAILRNVLTGDNIQDYYLYKIHIPEKIINSLIEYIEKLAEENILAANWIMYEHHSSYKYNNDVQIMLIGKKYLIRCIELGNVNAINEAVQYRDMLQLSDSQILSFIKGVNDNGKCLEAAKLYCEYYLKKDDFLNAYKWLSIVINQTDGYETQIADLLAKHEEIENNYDTALFYYSKAKIYTWMYESYDIPLLISYYEKSNHKEETIEYMKILAANDRELNAALELYLETNNHSLICDQYYTLAVPFYMDESADFEQSHTDLGGYVLKNDKVVIYTNRAALGNVYAQYALGKYYLEQYMASSDEFKDDALLNTALAWLYKADYAGVEEAARDLYIFYRVYWNSRDRALTWAIEAKLLGSNDDYLQDDFDGLRYELNCDARDPIEWLERLENHDKEIAWIRTKGI